jgi:CubicO group peptidase (beta-lactamase class C family)
MIFSRWIENGWEDHVADFHTYLRKDTRFLGFMEGDRKMQFSKLEKFVFEKVSDSKLPGISVALVKDGKAIWSRGFGFRDLEHGLAATPHTVYGIASVTKSFTCIAIMQLMEQGKLDVEEPVENYIPFPIRSAGDKVRLRHLMSHSSGIPALAYAESVINGVIGADQHWLPIATYEDMLTFLGEAQEWTVAKPGERFFYLNEGYVLLGYIIEKCSGVPYKEYIRGHIFRPLGMKRSFFDQEEVENDQDAATPYVITRDQERLPSRYPYGGITSDGGIISNVLDLAQYIAMFLGRGQADGNRILSPESIEMMESAHIATPLEGPFGIYGYGFGLGITADFGGYKLIGHSGGLGVATAYIGFIPERGVGIALLANGDGYPLSQMGMYGLSLLLDQDPEQLPFVQRERALDKLEGRYETYKGTMKASVRRAGDFLMLEVKDKYNDTVIPLVPEELSLESGKFYTLASGNRLPVEFQVREDDIRLFYERYAMLKTGELLK